MMRVAKQYVQMTQLCREICSATSSCVVCATAIGLKNWKAGLKVRLQEVEEGQVGQDSSTLMVNSNESSI